MVSNDKYIIFSSKEEAIKLLTDNPSLLNKVSIGPVFSPSIITISDGTYQDMYNIYLELCEIALSQEPLLIQNVASCVSNDDYVMLSKVAIICDCTESVNILKYIKRYRKDLSLVNNDSPVQDMLLLDDEPELPGYRDIIAYAIDINWRCLVNLDDSFELDETLLTIARKSYREDMAEYLEMNEEEGLILDYGGNIFNTGQSAYNYHLKKYCDIIEKYNLDGNQKRLKKEL